MKTLRKGISPIIATVLLILIAIATGIVIYAFATGWIGGRLNQGSGPQAVLVVETGYWNDTNPSNGNVSFVLYVRNDGGAPANITRAYITEPDGTIHYINTTYISDKFTKAIGGQGSGVVIDPGNVSRVVVWYDDLFTVQKGYAYKITLVSSDGAEVSYTVRA